MERRFKSPLSASSFVNFSIPMQFRQVFAPQVGKAGRAYSGHLQHPTASTRRSRRESYLLHQASGQGRCWQSSRCYRSALLTKILASQMQIFVKTYVGWKEACARTGLGADDAAGLVVTASRARPSPSRSSPRTRLTTSSPRSVLDRTAWGGRDMRDASEGRDTAISECS